MKMRKSIMIMIIIIMILVLFLLSNEILSPMPLIAPVFAAAVATSATGIFLQPTTGNYHMNGGLTINSNIDVGSSINWSIQQINLLLARTNELQQNLTLSVNNNIAMQNSINTLQASNNILQAQMSSANGNIAALQSASQAQIAATAALNQQIINTETIIGSMQQNITTAEVSATQASADATAALAAATSASSSAAAVASSIASINNNLATLTSTVNSNIASIATLQSSVASNTAAINTLQSTSSAATSSINALTSSVNNLQTSEATDASNIATLFTDINNNNADIANLQSITNGISNSISTIQTSPAVTIQSPPASLFQSFFASPSSAASVGVYDILCDASLATTVYFTANFTGGQTTVSFIQNDGTPASYPILNNGISVDFPVFPGFTYYTFDFTADADGSDTQLIFSVLGTEADITLIDFIGYGGIPVSVQYETSHGSPANFDPNQFNYELKTNGSFTFIISSAGGTVSISYDLGFTFQNLVRNTASVSVTPGSLQQIVLQFTSHNYAPLILQYSYTISGIGTPNPPSTPGLSGVYFGSSSPISGVPTVGYRHGQFDPVLLNYDIDLAWHDINFQAVFNHGSATLYSTALGNQAITTSNVGNITWPYSFYTTNNIPISQPLTVFTLVYTPSPDLHLPPTIYTFNIFFAYVQYIAWVSTTGYFSCDQAWKSTGTLSTFGLADGFSGLFSSALNLFAFHRSTSLFVSDPNNRSVRSDVSNTTSIGNTRLSPSSFSLFPLSSAAVAVPRLSPVSTVISYLVTFSVPSRCGLKDNVDGTFGVTHEWLWSWTPIHWIIIIGILWTGKVDDQWGLKREILLNFRKLTLYFSVFLFLASFLPMFPNSPPPFLLLVSGQSFVFGSLRNFGTVGCPGPIDMVLSQDGHDLYVVCENTQSVIQITQVDASFDPTVTTILDSTTCPGAISVDVYHATQTLYVVCAGTSFNPATYNSQVVAVDLGNGNYNISLVANSTYCVIPQGPDAVVVDQNTGLVFVSCFNGAIMINGTVVSMLLPASLCGGRSVGLIYDSCNQVNLIVSCGNTGAFSVGSSTEAGIVTPIMNGCVNNDNLFIASNQAIYVMCNYGPSGVNLINGSSSSSITPVISSTQCSYPNALTVTTTGVALIACGDTGIVGIGELNSPVMIWSGWGPLELITAHSKMEWYVGFYTGAIYVLTTAVLTLFTDQSLTSICGSPQSTLLNLQTGAMIISCNWWQNVASLVSVTGAGTTVLLTQTQCETPSGTLALDWMSGIAYVGCYGLGVVAVPVNQGPVMNPTVVVDAYTSVCNGAGNPYLPSQTSLNMVLYATCIVPWSSLPSVTPVVVSLNLTSGVITPLVYGDACDSPGVMGIDYRGVLTVLCGGSFLHNNYANASVISINTTVTTPVFNVTTIVNSNICPFPAGLTVNYYTGMIYVSCNDEEIGGLNSKLLAINAIRNQITAFGTSSSGVVEPENLLINPFTNHLYVASNGGSAGGILSLRLDSTGTQVINQWTIVPYNDCQTPGLLTYNPSNVTHDVFGVCGSNSITFNEVLNCLPGYSFTDQGCVYCPVGTYRSYQMMLDGIPNCLPCPPGSVTNQAGSEKCNMCLPSTYEEAATIPCVSCLAGYFTDQYGSIGQDSCRVCNGGFYGNISGSNSSCSGPCSKGYWCSEGSRSINQLRCGSISVFCPSNSASPRPVSLGWYTINSIDGTSLTMSDQSPCEIGNYCDGDGIQKLCVPGTYQNENQSSSCKLCQTTTYSSIYGATTCLNCPIGSTNINGSSTCYPCAPGTYLNALTSLCTDCSIGTYSPSPSSLLCLTCPPGQITPTNGSSYCSSCEPGEEFQVINGEIVCVECQIGTASLNGSVCETCMSGYAAPIRGAVICIACVPGKYLDVNSSTCLPCLIGTYSSSAASSECLPCPTGTIAPSPNSFFCLACLPGQTNSTFNSLPICMDCLAGTASISGDKCIPCEEGFYAPVNRSITCIACSPGYSSNATGSSSCLPCSIGSSSSSSSTINCDRCNPGSFTSTIGSITCTLCAPGTYQSQSGASTCDICQPGSYSNSNGATICSVCLPGTFAAQNGSIECEITKPGYFQPNNGSMEERNCQQGFFTAQYGATSCEPCGLGFYASNTSIACIACSPGYSSNATGSSSCLPCSIGSSSSSSSTINCDRCNPGSFTSTIGSITCTLCAPGTYQSQSGASTCDICQPGSYSNSNGATICSVCLPGTFAAQNGSIECEITKPGYFQPNNGSTEERNCQLGFFASQYGATTCLPCTSGRFTDRNGSSSCILCSPGTASNILALTHSCDLCAPGTFQSFTGDTACRPCELGKYSSNFGSILCSACDDGIINVNQTECASKALCLANQQLASIDNTCEWCELGKTSVPGGICTTCELNTYTPEIGANCVSCESSSMVGLNCVGGLAYVKSGYWAWLSETRDTNSGYYLFQTAVCPINYCKGAALQQVASAAAAANENNVTNVNSPLGLSFSTDQCTSPRSNSPDNTLCGSCEDGYIVWSNTCATCTGTDGLLIFIYLIFSLLLVSWSIYEVGSTKKAERIIHKSRQSIVLRKQAEAAEQQGKLGMEGNRIATSERKERASTAAADNPDNTRITTTADSSSLIASSNWKSAVVSSSRSASASSSSSSESSSSLPSSSGAGHSTILFYFIQISALELGPISSLLVWLSIANMNIVSTSGANCIALLSPMQQIILELCIPVILLCELGVIAVLHYIAHLVITAYYSSSTTSNSFLSWLRSFSVDRYIGSCIWLLLLIYTQIGIICIQYLGCIEVGDNTVIFNNPTINCNSNQYHQLLIIIVMIIIFFILGFPVAAFIILRRNQIYLQDLVQLPSLTSSSNYNPDAAAPVEGSVNSLILQSEDQSRVKFLQRYGPLFSMYRAHTWYWQLLVLFRRSLFVLIGVLLQSSAASRFMYYSFLHLVSLLLQIRIKPFRNPLCNQSETISIIILLVCSILVTAQPPPFAQSNEIILSCFVVTTILGLSVITTGEYAVLITTKIKALINNCWNKYNNNVTVSKADAIINTYSMTSNSEEKEQYNSNQTNHPLIQIGHFNLAARADADTEQHQAAAARPGAATATIPAANTNGGSGTLSDESGYKVNERTTRNEHTNISIGLGNAIAAATVPCTSGTIEECESLPCSVPILNEQLDLDLNAVAASHRSTDTVSITNSDGGGAAAAAVAAVSIHNDSLLPDIFEFPIPSSNSSLVSAAPLKSLDNTTSIQESDLHNNPSVFRQPTTAGSSMQLPELNLKTSKYARKKKAT